MYKKLIENPLYFQGIVITESEFEVNELSENDKLVLDNLISQGFVEALETKVKEKTEPKKTTKK